MRQYLFLMFVNTLILFECNAAQDGQGIKDFIGSQKDYSIIYKWAPRAYTNGPGSPANQSSDQPIENKIAEAHQRGNEVRSLMAEYLSSKMDQMKSLAQIGDDDSKQKLLNLLGPFCNPGEDALICKERYVQIHSPIVYKLKSGMEKSSDHVAELQCSRDSVGNCSGKSGMAVSVSQEPMTSRQMLPYLPTYQDLQEYAKMRQISLTPKDYQDWVKSLEDDDLNKESGKSAGTKPIIEDFVKTLRVPKEPGSSETVTIIKKKADGSPEYDEKAFQLALKTWEEDKKAIKEGIKGMASRQMNTSDLKKIQDDFQKKIDITNPDLTHMFTNYGIYAKARGDLVFEANQMTKKEAEPKSSPTGKPSTTPTERAVYDGTEQVDPAKVTGTTIDNTVIYNPGNFTPDRVIQFRGYNADAVSEGTPDGNVPSKDSPQQRKPSNNIPGASQNATSTPGAGSSSAAPNEFSSENQNQFLQNVLGE